MTQRQQYLSAIRAARKAFSQRDVVSYVREKLRAKKIYDQIGMWCQ
jgi:hypothetical protein